MAKETPPPSSEAPASAEQIEIYGGDVTLSFDSGKHKYYARSHEKDYGHIDSSTQILKTLAKPALLYWAVNQTIEYLEENLEPGRAYDEVEIDQLLSKAKSARYRTSNEALKIGTVVHDWIEKYIQAKIEGKSVGVIAPDQKEVNTDMVRDLSLPFNDQAQSSIQQFLAWEDTHDVEWVATEQRAFSKHHGYGGTYDADAFVDGKRSMVDWKTSKGIYESYWLQLGAYVYAREEELHYLGEDVKYDQALILRVPKTGGEFEAGLIGSREEITELAKVFLALYRVHQWNS